MIISLGMKKFIEQNALGLATVDKNGNPHNIAVAYCKVVKNKLIISNAHIRKSIANIKLNPKVALVVWNKGWEKACVGYEILGTAENHTRGQWLEFVKNLPDNEGYTIKSALVVEIKEIRQLKS